MRTSLDSARAKLAEIESATLFGSRAKGTHSPRSDVDLALSGSLGAVDAEAIAAELDELPLPYRFDVHALAAITHAPLLERIAGVGVVIYPEPSPPASRITMRRLP